MDNLHFLSERLASLGMMGVVTPQYNSAVMYEVLQGGPQLIPLMPETPVSRTAERLIGAVFPAWYAMISGNLYSHFLWTIFFKEILAKC